MTRDFLLDLKYAIRSFGKRPLFTGVVLVTLALGIGSNVAIFSVANAVLFRPLPFENPEELAFVWNRLPKTNVARSLVSGPDFKDYQTQTTRFEGFAAAIAVPGTLTGEGTAERITNAYVTPNLLSLLGARPILGRTHSADDAFTIDPKQFGSPNPDLPPGKVVLSHGLWMRRFGGDSSVLGRTIQMDGWGSVVVGVLPRDFRIYLPADAAMPGNIDAWGVLPSNISDFEREAPWLTVVTRLKPGVTPAQAQEEMDRLATRLRETHQFHATQSLQIVVGGMHHDIVEHARPALIALLGAVGFVLLIACANVANLLLVRASERGREVAVRAALGSGRARIVAQMLTESFVLGVGGMVLGLMVAWPAIGVIKAFSPANLPRIDTVSIDARAFAFAAAVTVIAVLLFGLAPALRAVRGNLAIALRERGTDTGGARGNKLRTVLVVSEMTLSLVLLIGAGLMVRSFAAIQKVDPGFDVNNAVTFNAPLPFIKYLTSATKAGWGTQLPPGRARGIAVCKSFESFVAEVAEVSVDAQGVPRVHRVVCAIDCGPVVNPAIVEAQLRSGVVFGLTAALYGEINIDKGRVTQGNFDTYRMLRMADMPVIETYIVPSTEALGGVGEPGTPPIAPAVCNAIFSATGKRIRRLPIGRVV